MAILKNETWDGVSSPSIPAGWNVSAVFTTGSPLSPETPLSNPNTLYLTPDGTSNEFFATWNVADGVSGNISVQASFNGNSLTAVTLYGVTARGSSATLDFTSTSFYRGTIDTNTGLVNIDKVVSGVVTNLVNVPLIGFFQPMEWYQITLTLNGTSFSLAVQRLSDSNWLHNISGVANWLPGMAIVATVTDGSLTGSGYAGINCRQSGGVFDPLYSDDFLFESIGTGTPPNYTVIGTFDDVTAPALPGGFSFDAGLVTTATFLRGIVAVTPPNALELPATGVSTIYSGTAITADQGGGDVNLMCYLNSASITGSLVGGLMARGSAFPLDPISSDFYWAELDFNLSKVRLSAVSAGAPTVLDSITISSIVVPDWHLLTMMISGMDLQVFVQRQSDGLWLDSSGNWTPGFFGPVLASIDSSIIGSGFTGMTLVAFSDTLLLDSWQSNSAISKTLSVPFYDRVFEAGTCFGVGNISLAGHFSSYQSFAIIGDGNPTGYCVADPINDAWEVGFGTYHSSGLTLSRNTVAASSNGNTFVNFIPGVKDVFTSISAKYIKRTTTTLFDHFNSVSNVSTGETDLYSDSLPGDTLAFDGDKISAFYAVSVISSGSTKRVRVYFAGTLIHDGTALTTSGAGNIQINVLIMRDSATSVRYTVSSTSYLATPVDVQSVGSLGSLTLTSPLVLKLTGQATATADLTAVLGSVSAVPAA
jgi:hypothetical protein